MQRPMLGLACLLTLSASALCLAPAGSGTARASDISLPVVEEHYDAVWVVHECLAQRDWQLRRAYFIRADKIVAERAVHDEMLWSSDGSQFVLVWDDYGVCKRRVTFDRLVEMPLYEASNQPQDQNPWWWMGRRMTDLKAPNE